MPKLKILLPVFLAICAFCFIAYSNSLHNPFIWDDTGLIVRNAFIQDWRNTLKAFSIDLYSGTVLGSNFFRPIQTVSFIADFYFWQLEPTGYHLTNIILQILVSFLVFLFACQITAKTAVSFLAAALFSVNPLSTEAVTYISGRAEMLMGLFLLAALILFIKSLDKTTGKKIIYIALSSLSFILALLSKELSLVFPLALCGYLYYFRREKFNKASYSLSLLSPYIIIALAYITLRLTVLNFAPLRPAALTQYPFILRLMVLPKIIFTYLGLLILPVDLQMSRTLIRPVSFIGVSLSWGLLVLICLICWRMLFGRNINKKAAFLLFWALIFFLPQSGLIPINAFVAEHFIYLSSISFFILAAYLLQRFLRKEIFIIASAGLLLFYGMLTYSRNADWKDPFVFYEKIIRLSPESFQAHNNLGLEYEYRNMFKQAEFEYKRALELRPDLIEARSNLANLYFKAGRFEEAKQEYFKVKESAPLLKLGEVENNIGCIYEVEGLWDEALKSYHLALKLDPGLNFTRFNIAKIYQAQGKIDLSARQIFDSLPEISNRNEKMEYYLALIKDYLTSAKISNSVSFYNDLGVDFASQGLFQAAVVSFRRSLELQPQYSDAYFNLGLAYWNLGRKREAVLAFKRTVSINPNHLRAKGFLAEIIYKK